MARRPLYKNEQCARKPDRAGEVQFLSFGMKGWYFFIGLLVSMSVFGQANDTLHRDTSAVHAFIRLSKDNQWKDPYRSLHFTDQALVLALELSYPEGVAMAKNQKGFSYWSFGDNDLAIAQAMEAVTLAQKSNNTMLQAESYYILARGYMDVAEREKAFEAIQKAVRLAEDGERWELLCSIYNLMGVIQFIDDKQDSALAWYNKAFELGKARAVDPVNFPRIISNIGECYAMENPGLAFTYFNKALDLSAETGNQISKASILAIVGHAYLRANDIRKAETNLTESLDLARRLGLRRVIRHAYAGLVDIKLRQGKGGEAVVYLRKYYSVRDSLLNTSKTRQIVELEARHALELKEQSILLLENEARIKTIWNNLLIGLVIVLVLLSVAGYQLQRYRYRKNREKLDLEIDYLTQRHRETENRIKDSLVSDSNEPVESQDQQLLRKAIAVVEEHLDDTQFGVEKMADEMSMSRTNLHRKVKSITGFPPSELIRSIRLRKAARLIANKADTISQIALRVGFDDYSHFSKSFKKHFGVTPNQYQ